MFWSSDIRELKFEIEQLKKTAITDDTLKQRVVIIVEALSHSNENGVSQDSHIKNLVTNTINDIISHRLRSIIDEATSREISANKSLIAEEIKKSVQKDLDSFKESIHEQKQDTFQKIDHDLGSHIENCPGKINLNLREDLNNKINEAISSIHKVITKNKKEFDEKIDLRFKNVSSEISEKCEALIANEINDLLKDYDNKFRRSSDTISERTTVKMSPANFVSIATLFVLVIMSFSSFMWRSSDNEKEIVELKKIVTVLNENSLSSEVKGDIKLLKENQEKILKCKENYLKENLSEKFNKQLQKMDTLILKVDGLDKLSNNNLNSIGDISDKVRKIEKKNNKEN